MLMRDLPLSPTRADHRLRGLATTALRAASRALDALAVRLSLIEAQPTTEPVLEFHAEAGAPEGALYVDGRLIGHVIGVTRL